MQYAGSSEINDIQLAEKMSFVVFVYLALTNKDMIKGFFDEHVQNVALLVPKEQIDEIAEETYLADAAQNAVAGNRNAVAEHLEHPEVVEVHPGSTHDAAQSPAEHPQHLLDHRLLLHLLRVLAGGL